MSNKKLTEYDARQILDALRIADDEYGGFDEDYRRIEPKFFAMFPKLAVEKAAKLAKEKAKQEEHKRDERKMRAFADACYATLDLGKDLLPQVVTWFESHKEVEELNVKHATQFWYVLCRRHNDVTMAFMAEAKSKKSWFTKEGYHLSEDGRKALPISENIGDILAEILEKREQKRNNGLREYATITLRPIPKGSSTSHKHPRRGNRR